MTTNELIGMVTMLLMGSLFVLFAVPKILEIDDEKWQYISTEPVTSYTFEETYREYLLHMETEEGSVTTHNGFHARSSFPSIKYRVADVDTLLLTALYHEGQQEDYDRLQKPTAYVLHVPFEEKEALMTAHRMLAGYDIEFMSDDKAEMYQRETGVPFPGEIGGTPPVQ